MAIMWNKITLRTKLTLLIAMSLSLLTILLTAFAVFNARQSFSIPLENFVTEESLREMHLMARDSQHNFRFYSIIVACVLMLISTGLAYFLAGRALKPIRHLTEKMESIDVNHLANPIEVSKNQDEISRLTRTFNSMTKKLHQAFESKKLFAQNAAHELKTPLASIRSNIDVLELDDEPSPEEYKEVINVVKNSTERLINLVEGLLSINNVMDKARIGQFSSRDVFETIIRDLNKEIKLKELTVVISGDCMLKGDKVLIERAFSNLVHNAVRYNVEKGKIQINLSESSISIEDTGIGIPENSLEHIFETFYCVDTSRSKSLGGNGLGMSIVKNIFDLHSIKVTISSEVGIGTKIILNQLNT